MSAWRQLTRGFRGLFNQEAANRDLAEEVNQFFEEAAAAGKARGLSTEDAQRAARLDLGTTTAVEEQVRSYGWENTVRTFAADLRYAARQMRTNSGFATVSILTLALGIGASTAIFSAVKPVLFDPMPYPQGNRIMMIWGAFQGARSEIAYGTYRELLKRSHSFDTMAVFEPWQPAISGNLQPERLNGQSVSASFFRVLRVTPLLGRDFQSSDEGPHKPKVVVLSERSWRHRFGGDPHIIGRQMKLDDDDYTVTGVMPASFENVLSPSAELWTPVQYDTSSIATSFDGWEWGNHLRLAGRLRAGVSGSQAAQELDRIASAPRTEFQRPRWASLRHGFIVDSMQEDISHSVRPALLAVCGAVVLVLFIACVNVINLVLARSSQRRGEFATRAALGASRSRIVRQLITESLLMSLLGGGLGLWLAVAGVRAIKLLSPTGLPRLDAMGIDGEVFAFALAITTLIGLVTGSVFALHVSRAEPHLSMQQSSRRTTGGGSWTRRALVITEVALALILLAGAGLLLRSMQRLLAVDPGFSGERLLTIQVQTFGHQFDDPSSALGPGSGLRRRFFERALEAVRRVPGVQHAAFTSLLPLSDDPPEVGVYGAQFENEDPRGGQNVFRYAVSPDFCSAMNIPLRIGRCLDERDTSDAPQSALISESLAKRRFAGGDPIGKRLHVGPNNRPWYTVVGVMGDIKQTSLAVDEPDAVYVPESQTWFADEALSLVVRTRGEPSGLVPAIRSAIWSVDKNQPVTRVATMDDLVAISQAERRFVLILFEAFGVVALALAAVGIFGVLSGGVTERTREIGVRAALGATRKDILVLVLGEGMRLTMIGVVIGLGGAMAVSQALTSLLFGVSHLDPVTYMGVILLLLGVSGIACWIPSWRAVQVDPALTLRAE